MKNKLMPKIVFILILMTIVFIEKDSKILAAETPKIIDENYIYFDLLYGDVVLNNDQYSGFVLENGAAVQKTGTIDRKIYIYQSNGNSTIWEDGLPKYDRVGAPLGLDKTDWKSFITNNTDVNSIITNWDIEAAKVNRTSTTYKVIITGTNEFDITIDNLWSSFHEKNTKKTSGGISFIPDSNKVSNATIYLKGDNRFGNIFFSSSSPTEGQIIFDDVDGGTVTLANLKTGANENKNYWCSALGGNDGTKGDARGIIINGGTIFAGTTYEDNCTAIGAGGNDYGDITINGGTVTAVVSSTGTAIGGGIGYNSNGGNADVKITGGTIYAYNFGREGIPAAAIGGGSSRDSTGNASTTITITGGNVYAESVGGAAIGGGSSKTKSGGNATINIGGNSIITAKSVAGTYNGTIINAGAAIGGGSGGSNAGSNGGDVTLNVFDEAKLYAGSIGGGKTNNATGKLGNATVEISGNPSIQGQVVMAAGSDEPSSFKMSGGTIDNSQKREDFIFLEKDGGAVHVENGDAIMDGGLIIGCKTAENGGAIYLSSGNFTMNGGSIGKIEDNKKIGNKAVRGGAVYIIGGNFTMNGGTIEGNTATESGGGIQISDGNVYITGGKILSNVARGEETTVSEDVGYGGGIYIDGGEIVSITGGEISKNVAAKNGGGIEVRTDKVVTIDVYSGTFIDNVADECGGAVGIDCDNGTINVGKVDCDGSSASQHSHPNLAGNLAGVQGGGFYMSGKDAILNIYCGTIDNNIVVAMENNFDQSSGTVTVYDGVQIGKKDEGIIVIGGTFVDKRTENETKLGITYYSNFQGSTEYKHAVVTKGILITLPSDIFNVDGYEIVGWSTNLNNAGKIEYNTGETLVVEEEVILYAVWVLDEQNKPTFVIVIPNEINFSNETNTIVFDIKATLSLFPRTKMLNVNIAEEEYALKYIKDGKIKDIVKYEIIRENEKIEAGGVIASFVSDTALINYEGREELELKIINKPKYIGAYKGDLTFFISIEDIK